MDSIVLKGIDGWSLQKTELINLRGSKCAIYRCFCAIENYILYPESLVHLFEFEPLMRNTG